MTACELPGPSAVIEWPQEWRMTLTGPFAPGGPATTFAETSARELEDLVAVVSRGCGAAGQDGRRAARVDRQRHPVDRSPDVAKPTQQLQRPVTCSTMGNPPCAKSAVMVADRPSGAMTTRLS